MKRKDIFDRSFATFVLVGLLPLLLLIALAVKCSSPGPVLFRQQRSGLGGNVFTIYKFRTMRLHVAAPGMVRQATRDDGRVTSLGGWLRRTSLDELPQFFNVLCGDMSVVGPRPHALEHDEIYRAVIARYSDRYQAKPGITGWAQVHGLRGETDSLEKMAARVEHDLFYLRHRSFGLDLRIIVMTMVRGLSYRTAY
jgi:putative colanic acid biosynthesis UDP-glucose lipid carrier transferase